MCFTRASFFKGSLQTNVERIARGAGCRTRTAGDVHALSHLDGGRGCRPERGGRSRASRRDRDQWWRWRIHARVAPVRRANSRYNRRLRAEGRRAPEQPATLERHAEGGGGTGGGTRRDERSQAKGRHFWTAHTGHAVVKLCRGRVAHASRVRRVFFSSRCRDGVVAYRPHAPRPHFIRRVLSATSPGACDTH